MRHIAFAPLVALGLSLTACGGTNNRGLETVHQPVVTRTNFVYDVPASVSGEDSARLTDWFESIGVGYGDRIAVDDPHGNPGARTEIGELAAQYGLLIDRNAPITPGAVAPGSVRVIVSRSRAEVPGCPDWSRDSASEFSAAAMSNYGCATNSNLAAMVANPDDLILGQSGEGAGSDARTAAKAIRVYRESVPTGTQGLKAPGTRGGNQ